MSLSLNTCMFAGRLTADPELRTTTTGKSVATFTIAIDRTLSQKDGEKKTDFILCVAWEKTAEFCCNYFKKGQAIFVRGEMQSRSYEDKNGYKRTILECVTSDIRFVESKNATASVPSANSNSYASAASTAASVSSSEIDDLEEEDLPF